MEKLQRIRIFALAIFQAILSSFLGLLAGILYSFGGLIIDTLVSIGWITSSETPGLSFGTFLAFGALIGMPVIFAIGGFLAGIVEAILYNLFAKKFGGLNINFNKKENHNG